MKTTTIYLAKKKSGNFTVSTFMQDAWELIATCETPSQLLDEVKKLPEFSTVIKSEYSQSQLKCNAFQYSKKDALRAFELKISNENIAAYFTN